MLIFNKSWACQPPTTAVHLVYPDYLRNWLLTHKLWKQWRKWQILMAIYGWCMHRLFPNHSIWSCTNNNNWQEWEYAPMLVDTLRMWTESNSIVLIERKERSSHGSTCKKEEKHSNRGWGRWNSHMYTMIKSTIDPSIVLPGDEQKNLLSIKRKCFKCTGDIWQVSGKSLVA